MVMITEQPGVNIAFAQRRLNGSQIHGQTSIVNKGMSLGEFSRLVSAHSESGPRKILPLYGRCSPFSSDANDAPEFLSPAGVADLPPNSAVSSADLLFL
jgi:hypothetical protein